jgi:hypothetical protein
MEENVELVREQVEAFNRGDLEAVLKPMHPDIEWQVARQASRCRDISWPRRGPGVLADPVRHVSRLSIALGAVRAGRRALRSRHPFRLAEREPEAGSGWNPPPFFQAGEIRDGHGMWTGQFSTVSDDLEAAALRE